MIVEVLVSAVILVMVSLAVFATLDKTDAAAGTQQRRAQAANFAQSELERIRSLPVEDIAALRGTRTVVRDGIDYTYKFAAKWVSDDENDEPQCTSRSGGLDYMRTTVTISWEGMGNADPVSYTSLFTPTAGAGGDTGSVSVHLVNRDGNPVVGVGITLDGPSTYTETTNKNGCVVFGFVPASLDYELRFSRAGYVNADSVNIVKDALTVTAKETTKLQYLYDSGGFTKVSFKTRVSGTMTASTPYNERYRPTHPAALQMFHAEQNTPGKTVPLSGNDDDWDGSPSGTPTPWFPFKSPYAIYAGNCTKNTPPTSMRFQDPDNGPQDALKMVNISPMATQPTGTVQLPAVNVRFVTGGPGSPPNNGIVGADVSYLAECGVMWNRKTVGEQTSPFKITAGSVADPGVPYSANLKICMRWNGRNSYLKPTNPLLASNKDWQEVTFYENPGNLGPNTLWKTGPASDCFQPAT